MRTEFKGRNYVYAFDSLRELGLWIDNSPRVWRANSSGDNTCYDDWDLSAGYEGAVTMAQRGWKEGAGRVKTALASLAPKQPAPNERNDFYGFRPNVPRYCAGAPDCMVRREVETGAGKSLSLVVSVGAMGHTDANAMANYGAAIAGYIHQQELEGVRCEVRAASCVSIGGNSATISVVVKRAGQPLDLAVMAFAVGHPAMLRRIIFAARERSQIPERGYGSTDDVLVRNVLGAPASSIVLHGIRSANRIARTPEQALESIAQEIASKRKG